jgi:hypothetical protein
MALPTSAIPSRFGRKTQIYTISAQTASFDFPFQVKGAQAMCLQMTGTIGTATSSLQASIDGVNFVDVAVQQTHVVGHTELLALTIALSPYSVNFNDLGYPFWNIHHTAAGGSSIAFLVAVMEF